MLELQFHRSTIFRNRDYTGHNQSSTEPDQASPLAEEDVSLVEREGPSDNFIVNDTETEGWFILVLYVFQICRKGSNQHGNNLVVQLKTNIGEINVLVLPLENAFSGMIYSPFRGKQNIF